MNSRKMKIARFQGCVVLFLLFLVIAPLRAPAADFKFVVWGDSQFHNLDVFQRSIVETEALKPSFVLQVGDMIHGYTYDPENARRQWALFKRQLQPLTVPFYPVPGNHDVTTAEIEPVYGEVWGNDRYYYSFDLGSSHFVVLNTYAQQKYDTIVPEHMEWLRDDLEKHKESENIFLAFHSPLHMNESYDWNSVHNLLKKYPVRGVFTGHSHIYDYRRLDGIDYFCLNTSGWMPFNEHLLGHSHHFIVVSVRDKQVDYAVVTDGRIYPPDAVPPDEYKKARTYLKEEQTIIIPDPAEQEIYTTVTISLDNQTLGRRAFELTWETEDFRWDFDPWGARVTLEPGEKNALDFVISGPRDYFSRANLPRLKVESPYTNSRGYSTTLVYYHRLFTPPKTGARRLIGELTLDGKLTEEAWKQTPSIKQLYLDAAGHPAPEDILVKVLYDDTHLYVYVEGEEPRVAGLAAYAHGDLPLVFGDDDFELYFDTNRDLKTFYRLMTNPEGIILCSGPDGLFSFKFDVKTFIGRDYWSTEFKIPFSELKTTTPQPGAQWGFNVRRHRQQAIPAQRDWSKMNNFPYQPQYFGLLVFQ